MSEKEKAELEITDEKVTKEAKKKEPEISKSKQKRIDREKNARVAKRQKRVGKIIETVVFTAIAGIFIAAIVMNIYKNATKLGAAPTSVEYSAGLTEAGFIDGADLSTVKDIGLANLVIPSADVTPTEDTIEEKIKELLEANEYSSDDASLTVADQDKVNISFTGTVDGEEFEGGSSDSYDLTIGSNSFIDDFETQLIGSHPGDTVNVEVTFPEDYSNEELQNKDAVFVVNILGIYQTPEFTDEFVEENYSDVASTAAEYRQYISDTELESNVETYISTYVSENASVTNYPKNYLKQVKNLLYYYDDQSYQYMNSLYSSYYGVTVYSSVLDYVGKTEDEYKKDLNTRSKTEVASVMTYEKLFKDQGLTVTDEVYNEVLEDYGENAEDTYGKPYLMQIAVKKVVDEYIKAHYTIQ